MGTELLGVDERRPLKGKVSANSWSVPCVHVTRVRPGIQPAPQSAEPTGLSSA